MNGFAHSHIADDKVTPSIQAKYPNSMFFFYYVPALDELPLLHKISEWWQHAILSPYETGFWWKQHLPCGPSPGLPNSSPKLATLATACLPEEKQPPAMPIYIQKEAEPNHKDPETFLNQVIVTVESGFW